MKKTITLICCLFFCFAQSQQDSLTVYYFENYPYAYTEADKAKGIEVDIIEEYVTWAKQKRSQNLVVTYKPYYQFSAFYNAVKSGGPGVIGIGSVTWNSEREAEVSFSPAYLRNVAVLVTAGTVPTVRQKTPEATTAVLGKLTAVGVNKSSHINYLNEIKKSLVPAMKITTVETQQKVLETVASDPATFGFVDIIAYWAYLKNNPTKFLKIQKVFNEPKEVFGFVLPKKSNHLNSIGEFFESGFGFTSTKKYRQILEKYLGYEIIDDVEVK